MRRFLVPLALTFLVAVGLSACDVSVIPGAARIGSESISTSTVTDAVRAIADDPAFVCTLANDESGTPFSIHGSGAGTYDAGFTASQLTEIIEQRVSTRLLAKLGIAVTPAETAIALSQLDGKLNPPSGSTCKQTGTTAVADLAASYREVVISQQTSFDLLAAKLAGVPLSPAGLDAYASAHQAATYNFCISAILSSTKSTATTARSAIESGQSFASVAKADSQDPTSAANGGALGCLTPSEVAGLQPPLNTTLQTIPVGQVSQAIELSNGSSTAYVLLLLTGRQAPTTLETLTVLVEAENTATNALLAQAESTTDVRVDPAYGTWRKVGLGYEVVPPVGPASGFLANPTAITPPTVPLG